MTGRTARRRVTRIVVDQAEVSERADLLAAEEPLGIRISGQAVSVTMRTPGDDVDLTAGFLSSEGFISSAADIASIRICDGAQCGHDHQAGDAMGNIADVVLRPGLTVQTSLRRSFLTSIACGVCGKASIDELLVPGRFDLLDDQTGRHPDQDVGRHNAVDKVIGWALHTGHLPLQGCVLMVSGRASFELVQKAVLAGIPVLAAVSAPSSLAAELAHEAGLTLAGFVRGGSMNVYAGPERLSL